MSYPPETEQKTGERSASSDLLQVLGRTHRRSKSERYLNGIAFGTYMTAAGEGTLRVGDQLSIEMS